MKTDTSAPLQTKSIPSLRDADEDLLSSFDPVIEGSTFQIMAEGLDPSIEFARELAEGDTLEIPEVLTSFDLAESLASVPNKLFFRIGEVAELLEVKPYVLRFWETEFTSVSPSKSKSGQRVYRKKHVENLLLIKHLLYVERFSIEGARKRLREMKSGVGSSLSSTPSRPVVAGPSLAASQSLRETLESVKQLAQTDVSHFFRF